MMSPQQRSAKSTRKSFLRFVPVSRGGGVERENKGEAYGVPRQSLGQSSGQLPLSVDHGNVLQRGLGCSRLPLGCMLTGRARRG